VRAAFDVAAAALGSLLDVEQEPVDDRRTLLGDQLAGRRPGRWRRHRVPQGVYLHGPVGRGKTWLVDVLLEQLPVDGVLRLHAYDAARQLHAQVARQAGSSGATDRAVDAVLAGVRLLFLDELHAHDPGDAMLLSRLVHALASRGAVLVATSNYPPHGLLPDPRHHALVLPLVAALEQHGDVLELAGPVDHRAHGHGGARQGWSSGAWAYPGSAAQRVALALPVPEPGDRVRLTVGGRPLWALAEQDGCVQLDFAELCAGTTSVGDLLELADRYRTLVLDHVPPLAAVTPDARRQTTLRQPRRHRLGPRRPTHRARGRPAAADPPGRPHRSRAHGQPPAAAPDGLTTCTAERPTSARRTPAGAPARSSPSRATALLGDLLRVQLLQRDRGCLELAGSALELERQLRQLRQLPGGVGDRGLARAQRLGRLLQRGRHRGELLGALGQLRSSSSALRKSCTACSIPLRVLMWRLPFDGDGRTWTAAGTRGRGRFRVRARERDQRGRGRCEPVQAQRQDRPELGGMDMLRADPKQEQLLVLAQRRVG